MRVSSTFLGFAAAACLTLTPVCADSNGAAAGSKPLTAGKPTTTGKPTTSKPTTSGKPTGGKPAAATTTRTSGKPTTTGKPTKSTSGKPTGTKSGSTSTTSGSGSTSTNTGSTSTTTTGGSGSTTTTQLNPIAAKIASKPNLNSKITGMLPTLADGTKMTLNQASLGFKNQGQFIAALHVSQNLGISFTELKSHMVTVTPGVGGAEPTATQTGSLGQAIQAVKKTADSTTEAQKAETQATSDLVNAGPTTTTTTNTTTTSTSSPNKTKKKTTTGGAQ
jgi:hypothetical protein